MALMLAAPGWVCAEEADIESGEVTTGKKVVIIPVQDQITGRHEVFFRRIVREANEVKADLLLLDMKTPGGSLAVTMEIFNILDSFNGDTVTFVNDEAYSAGALIAAATHRIYMKPDSVMGAATAIMMGPGGAPMELPESVDAKFSSALRAKVRSKATRNGHNAEVFEAMIDRKLKLEIDGQVLCDEGEILTLTGEEAFREFGDPPKPLVAAGLVENIDDLLGILGYKNAERIQAQETGSETLGYWLDLASPILLLVAVVGLYMEFKTPGFGVPGLIGIVAAALYFLGGYVAGFSTWAWMLVFLVGVALIFGEVLLFPGTFVLGITGLVLMVASLTMAFLDYDPNRDPQPQNERQTAPERYESTRISPAPVEAPEKPAPSLVDDYLTNALLKRAREFGAVFLMLAVTLFGLAKILPKTPYYHRIVSTTASGVESVKSEKSQHDALIGVVGRCLTDLHPGGKAQFGSRVLDVISDDGVLDSGTSVRIVAFTSSTARVVKDATSSTHTEAAV